MCSNVLKFSRIFGTKRHCIGKKLDQQYANVDAGINQTKSKEQRHAQGLEYGMHEALGTVYSALFTIEIVHVAACTIPMLHTIAMLTSLTTGRIRYCLRC